jgi:hypothetical protein
LLTRRPSLALAALATSGALALAGCGGDDDTATTASGGAEAGGASGPALTKDQFIAQADAICAAGDRTIEEAIEALGRGGEPSPADLHQFSIIAVPAIQQEVDAIEALPPPEGDEDEVEAILAAVQKGIDEIRSDPTSIESDPLAEADRLAEDYGLEQCGGN